MKLHLILTLLCLGQVCLAGTTYYVSAAGSDGNAGTSIANAWKTIARVNQKDYGAGDSILLEGGKTFGGSLYFAPTSGGTAASPVTVSSYGTGRATISAGNGSGLFAYDNGGFLISNLLFAGAGATVNKSDGVSFYNDLAGNVTKDFVQLQNVEVTGFGQTGFPIGGGNGTSGYSNVLASDCSFHDNLRCGAICYGLTFTPATPNYALSNVHFLRCAAYNNNGDPASTTNTGNGIIIGSANGGLVEYCVAHDNGINNQPSEGPVGIWAYDSTSVVIQCNESYSNHTSGTGDGDGFDFDQNVTNSTLQYNYSHDNDAAGYLVFATAGKTTSGIVVRYNISQNDGRKLSYGGIHVAGVVDSVDIYNNTVYMTSGTSAPAALKVTNSSGTPKNLRIRNNIFQTHFGSTGSVRLLEGLNDSTHTYQGNDYYNDNGSFGLLWGGVNYSSLNSWLSAASAQERLNGTIIGQSVNPLLTAAGSGPTLGDATLLPTLSAYQLQAASPLIDAGLNLSLLFGLNPGSRDFYNISLMQGAAPDIGAHEYGFGTLFDAWLHAAYGTSWVDPAIAAPAADPKGTGVKNLVQYGLGLTPATASVNQLPGVGQVTVSGSNYLTLTFTRLPANTDLTYVVQESADLTTWNDGSSYAAGSIVASNPYTTEVSRIALSGTETIIVRDNAPIQSNNPRRFLRLSLRH